MSLETIAATAGAAGVLAYFWQLWRLLKRAENVKREMTRAQILARLRESAPPAPPAVSKANFLKETMPT